MANKKAPDGNRMNAEGTVQNLMYYPKPGDGPTFLPGKGTKPSKEEIKKIKKMMKDRKLMPKKSGAGYSGSY